MTTSLAILWHQAGRKTRPIYLRQRTRMAESLAPSRLTWLHVFVTHYRRRGEIPQLDDARHTRFGGTRMGTPQI